MDTGLQFPRMARASYDAVTEYSVSGFVSASTLSHFGVQHSLCAASPFKHTNTQTHKRYEWSKAVQRRRTSQWMPLATHNDAVAGRA